MNHGKIEYLNIKFSRFSLSRTMAKTEYLRLNLRLNWIQDFQLEAPFGKRNKYPRILRKLEYYL